MKINWKKNYVYPLLALAIMVVDLFIKYIVLRTFAADEKAVLIEGILSSGINWNDGFLFGRLEKPETWSLLLIVGITLISLTLVLILFFIIIPGIVAPSWRGLAKSALMMVIGGAFANVADRLYHNAVLNYLTLNLGGRQLPFNLADVFITAGTLILVILAVNPIKAKTE